MLFMSLIMILLIFLNVYHYLNLTLSITYDNFDHFEWVVPASIYRSAHERCGHLLWGFFLCFFFID